ncbi:hypothetical protein V2J09_012528 [Rumex salicifolius]
MDIPAESETANPNTDTTTTSAGRPVRNAGGVSGGSGGREDCWSEEATAVLIEAWGERHLRCNRGNLRQNDWREVSDAVNGMEDGTKPRKSDVQCKNRIDTLKKKYKVEKAKSAPSMWPFFGRLDYLIGPGAGGKKSGSPASNFTPKQRPSRFRLSSCPNQNPNSSGSTIPKPRSAALAVLSGGSSSRFNSLDSSDSESSLGGGENGKGPASSFGGGVGKKRSRLEVNSPPQETGFRELAKAILKFGEIYERIESSKQRQLVELERQRMEFTKELEFQRMNMLMEAQLEIEKVKRSKNASNSGGTSNKL